ncbi:hypothetical protein GCM10023063_18170 [Arthrobacter methylotrophus]
MGSGEGDVPCDLAINERDPAAQDLLAEEPVGEVTDGGLHVARRIEAPGAAQPQQRFDGALEMCLRVERDDLRYGPDGANY